MPETRRDFLNTLVRLISSLPFINSLGCTREKEGVSSLFAASSTPGAPPPHTKLATNRIVNIRSNLVLKNIRVNDEILEKMVTLAVEKLTAMKGVDGWRLLFSPSDVVAIKASCLPGRRLSTHPELTRVITEKLKEVGVKEENIIIFDRTSKELKAAGFKINKRGENGVLCFGTNEDGVGYDNEPTVLGELASRFSRIISEYCSAIINVPVLKDHDLCGISASLKNHLGSIDNPNRCHTNGGNPTIVEVNSASSIRDKTRLIICDALEAIYDGGPAYNPGGTWKYNGIIAGVDPVALDTLALQIIEEKRREKSLPTLKAEKRFPHYIKTASEKKYDLGCSDLSKVELIKIDPSQFDSRV